MKKLFLSMLATAALLATSCSDDDSPVGTDDNGGTSADAMISGEISEDMTLTNDRIWTMDGRTTVTPGNTLTIEEGTIIKGEDGTGANASVLVIARDAQIDAQGTADAPIIFTSIADNIELGEVTSPNLGPDDRGLWGGVLILGNAPGSFDGDPESIQIEGIPANDTNGLYGGSDSNDNSGTFRYVSIRHGGTELSEGNEINGLTLGGVGNGTTIDHIEVVANSDDGIEFFGGTVDASDLFVWAQGDDAIDIDQAYNGTITNVGVVLGGTSDHALEIDGPEGSLEDSFTINGAYLVGNADTDNGEIADFRSRAMGDLNNIFITGFKSDNGDVDSDIELSGNVVTQNYLDGDITFSNIVVDASSFTDGGLNVQASDIFVEDVLCTQNCDSNNPVFEPLLIDDSNNTLSDRLASETTNSSSVPSPIDLSEFSWTFANMSANLGF